MQLTPANVEFIFDYIEDLCGIALDDTKGYLIEARLSPLVKQHALKSPVELIEKAKQPTGEAIRKSLVEAMTTRETFFFRDNSPFEALQFKALPELLDVKLKENNRKLRVWSAAASTGQEACSIGIVICEMIPDMHKWDIQILATDISEDALTKARSGIYTKMEVERGLPKQYVSKYFSPASGGYKITDSIHRMIKYQQLNLLAPFQFPHLFDIIFCRNVAIYFEKKVKIDLFRRMLKLMPRYGTLFVGASESLFDCGPEFRPMQHCKSTFYQPNLLTLPPGTINSMQPTVSRPRTSAVPSQPPLRAPASSFSPRPAK